MERCWTCETEVIGNHYTCSVCEKTRTTLFESPIISKSTTMSKFIDYSITELFFGKKDTQLYIAADISSNLENISATLENIASIIEWGFEELSWKMDQMRVILQSIDHSLKTPDETKANEHCLMAEELRRRGLLADSEKYFLQSLELNPLNYRTYIGLAQTYLKMNQFDKGKELLNKSFPHAIDNIKKSYAYRLLGRTFFAEGKLEKALEALELSIKISPDYALGHYDYAKYCALTGREEYCLNSLEIAIIEEPSLIKLIEKEPSFRVIGGIKALLERFGLINSEIFGVAPLAVRKYYELSKELDAVEAVLKKITQEYIAEHGREIEGCHRQFERAKAEIKKLQSRLQKGDHDVRFMFAVKTRRPAIVEQMTKTAKNMIVDLEKRLTNH